LKNQKDITKKLDKQISVMKTEKLIMETNYNDLKKEYNDLKQKLKDILN